MEFSREKMRQIRYLMLLTALLILALRYSDRVFRGLAFLSGILSPFLVGGIIAFVLNIPMRVFEEKVFAGWKGKRTEKMKRFFCLALSLAAVILAVALAAGTVVPQVVSTASELGRKIPAFTDRMREEIERLSENYPELTAQIEKMGLREINWDSVMDGMVHFLKNGAGEMLNSTVSVAGGIISGVVNMIVSFIFALYILTQKERLENQGRRIVAAYLPDAAGEKALEVCSLLYRNFSSFITGQCLESLILGTMFVIVMSICRMPYALMVGVLIAFTALIPIVGSFIGCGVGAFLILMDNPKKALWFVILFLVLQQIEGNLVYPKVVGNSVGLPAVWVLAAVSIGGSLFGVAGILFFIPLASTCYALFRESVNHRNAGKSMTQLRGAGTERISKSSMCRRRGDSLGADGIFSHRKSSEREQA